MVDQWRVSSERIFWSQRTAFASDNIAATHGCGANVMVNTLAGDLSKRDIAERNVLSLEPLGRNCTFRTVDVKNNSITDEEIHR